MKRNPDYILIIDVEIEKYKKHYEKLFYLNYITTYDIAVKHANDICENHNSTYSNKWTVKAIYALCGGVAR